MPLTDVAATLGVPVGTVKSRLHRALGEMRVTVVTDAARAVDRRGRAAGMTMPSRIERNLPAILDELSAAPTPDYLDDVFGRTGRMRQRPAWTFPGRWIPMADIARIRTVAPAPPWRMIALSLLVIALLIVVALLAVGSRRQPAPPVRAGRATATSSTRRAATCSPAIRCPARRGCWSAARSSTAGRATRPTGRRIAFIRNAGCCPRRRSTSSPCATTDRTSASSRLRRSRT